MPLSAAAKQQSDLVKRNINRFFLHHPKETLTFNQRQAVRKQIAEALRYLDANAIKVGDTSADVLDALGPPYIRMPENDWLYPADELDSFYLLRFVAGRVAKKGFLVIYDIESGK